MNKTAIALCLVLLLAVCFAGCGGREDGTGPELEPITTPEAYCAAFDDADLIVADDGEFYVEATRVNWVTELDLQDSTPVASVARSGVTAGFRAWDATTLPEGAAISRHNGEPAVLVAERDGAFVPYLQYTAG